MPAEVRPATGSSVLDGVWKTRRLFRRTQLRPLHKPVPLEGSRRARCPPHPRDGSSSLVSVMRGRSGRALKVRPFGAGIRAVRAAVGCVSPTLPTHHTPTVGSLSADQLFCPVPRCPALPPLSQKRITHRCACQSLQSHDQVVARSETSFDFTDATRH